MNILNSFDLLKTADLQVIPSTIGFKEKNIVLEDYTFNH